ncbi:hypothetical protein OCU04_010752 [Sclerotinia nivalis]|uniref:Uncharacterized protein n=1 Tax=Sclerotinia nivalis TaxID=352851 RepID=A0A9X0ACQ2_9HELO|nr:hypothetical protein OCU04_010752 [Sclerotinia nivalis]
MAQQPPREYSTVQKGLLSVFLTNNVPQTIHALRISRERDFSVSFPELVLELFQDQRQAGIAPIRYLAPVPQKPSPALVASALRTTFLAFVFHHHIRGHLPARKE